MHFGAAQLTKLELQYCSHKPSMDNSLQLCYNIFYEIEQQFLIS